MEGRQAGKGGEGGEESRAEEGKMDKISSSYITSEIVESLKLGGGHINPEIHFLEKNFQFQHFLHILALFLHTH